MGANESQVDLIGGKLLSYGADRDWPILAPSSLMGLPDKSSAHLAQPQAH